MGTRRHWIDAWNPEDETFWNAQGHKIARRNLIWSILAENLGFSVWLIWSVVATRLPKVGFRSKLKKDIAEFIAGALPKP